MDSAIVITSFLLVLSPMTSAVLTKVTCTSPEVGPCENSYCNLSPDGKVSFGCGKLTASPNEIIISQEFSADFLGFISLPTKLVDFEFCDFIKRFNEVGFSWNTFLYMLFGTASYSHSASTFKECPYTGEEFQIQNVGLGRAEPYLGYFQFFTKYAINYQMKNSKDENIFTVRMIGDTRLKGTSE